MALAGRERGFEFPIRGNANPDPQLLSLRENDGYMLSCAEFAPLARNYDRTGVNATSPLAWPYFAEPSDLEGLPPHVISVNELDPLRDEGLAYYRQLVRAGMRAASSRGRRASGRHARSLPRHARRDPRLRALVVGRRCGPSAVVWPPSAQL